MPDETLLLSVRPTFANRILSGEKTVELRRVRPDVVQGQSVLIYGSSPTMALLASATIELVESDTPERLWRRVRNSAGVSFAEYTEYFLGASRAVAIHLSNVEEFSAPIPLHQLRQRWPWFRPPQSYCFVNATFNARRRQVSSLAPRTF